MTINNLWLYTYQEYFPNQHLLCFQVKFVQKCGDDDICQSNLLMIVDLPDLKRWMMLYLQERQEYSQTWVSSHLY